MDRIKINIPASPAYLQVVRLAVAGLGSRLGFTIDDIEDLKIAVDEMSAYFTGTQGREGTIDVTFDVYDDHIEVSGRGNFRPGEKVRTDLTEFSKMILQTVVDTASLTQHDGTPVFELTKSKR